MELIVIQCLPERAMVALHGRAARHGHSIEVEARHILIETLESPATLVDVLGADDGADIEFQPTRLGLTGQRPIYDWNHAAPQ